MDFLELAKKRYSVRKYEEKEIPSELLDKMLETVKWAPTARGLQPQKIYVVKSKDALQKLSQYTKCTFNAPLVFIFGYDRNIESFDIDNEDHRGVVDIDIVQTHIMLEAADLGLGTCWVKMFDAKGIRSEFNIPNNIKLTGIMPCGYIASDSKPSPHHEESRELSEMVSFL